MWISCPTQQDRLPIEVAAVSLWRAVLGLEVRGAVFHKTLCLRRFDRSEEIFLFRTFPLAGVHANQLLVRLIDGYISF